MKKNNFPNSWADVNLENLLKLEFVKWNQLTRKTAFRLGISNHKAVKSDLSQVTVPEIISSELSIAVGNFELRNIAASLQAFQTYRLSLYDVLNDEHMTKLKRPTFLALYGEKECQHIIKMYSIAVMKLAEELKKLGIKNAQTFAEAQYAETLNADSIRNDCERKMPTVNKTIEIVESLAGNPAKYIAKLTTADVNLEELAKSLVNSMATLEDLIDFVILEDFGKIKATLPLSLLNEEMGLIDERITLEEIMKKTSAVSRTKEYILSQLKKSEGILSQYSRKCKILKRFMHQLNEFTERFPEDYIK